MSKTERSYSSSLAGQNSCTSPKGKYASKHRVESNANSLRAPLRAYLCTLIPIKQITLMVALQTGSTKTTAVIKVGTFIVLPYALKIRLHSFITFSVEMSYLACVFMRDCSGRQCSQRSHRANCLTLCCLEDV